MAVILDVSYDRSAAILFLEGMGIGGPSSCASICVNVPDLR